MNDVLITQYLAFATEPVHVGSRRAHGNSSLPDISVARDIDGFPYIPASSLKGSVRSLCSMTLGAAGCDGKGWNCSQPHKCPSCAVFGFSNFHHGRTSASLVRFSSARILSVPLSTDRGMVWVTSWQRLRQSGVCQDSFESEPSGLAFAEDLGPSYAHHLDQLLPRPAILPTSDPQRISTQLWAGYSNLHEIYRHMLVVDEHRFSSLTRFLTGSETSISIDSQTGHARSGALFETEFINRMSLLFFDAVIMNPALRGIYEFVNAKNNELSEIPATLVNIAQMVNYGLDRLQYFGIGGKRSRGYGRILVWEINKEILEESVNNIAAPSNSLSRPLVFISYSSIDKAIARRLAADLQLQQFDVWLDERRILVGDSIHEKVEEGIEQCDYLVLLISPDSLQSRWVTEEVNAVRTREKSSGSTVLLPIVFDGITLDRLPSLLRDRRFAILSAKTYEDTLQEIVNSIRGHEDRRRQMKP